MKIVETDIIRVAQQLPASPRILARLSEVLSDMNSGADDVVDLVKADPGITSGLIRLSNSALFAFTEPSTTLEEAICRVGFREVYRLVGLASTRALFPKQLELYGISGDQMWENSIATALAMEALARKNRDLDDRVAYTIGLLRSSGKIILSRIAAESEPAALYPGEEVEPFLGEWEHAQFGMSSDQACAHLMQHWKYPAAIAATIRHQATPLETPSAPMEAYMLNIAGGIARQVGGGISGETLYWRRHPEKFVHAGISQDDVEEAVGEVKSGLEGLRAAVASARI
ncbi:MAG TPA: HDOD domain-containing protein [Opitutaceae bacterium]|nr:HDOD domain-containing protein [Opitutaceae bacterium]